MTKQVLTDEQIDRVCDEAFADMLPSRQIARRIEATVLAAQGEAKQGGEFEGDALKLAKAIAEATFKGGVYNGVAPLNGPLMLMLLDDLATVAATAQAQGEAQPVAACQACGLPATKRIPDEATDLPGPYCDECWPTPPAAPSAEARDAALLKMEAMLGAWIESDPDAAERFIESQLARLALRKRLAAHGGAVDGSAA